VTPYQCSKGCRDPKAKDGREWHRNPNECPFETFDPKYGPGRPGKMRAKGHQGTPAQPARAPNVPAPRAQVSVSPKETITFTDKPADVTKGTSKPVEPVVVDYVLDGPHVLALWNFGLRGIYFIHVRIDEWVFDWHQHLPEKQFVLSKNAEMSISLEPRNFYARAATWFTKNICMAKNLKDAQAAVDGILFFEAFGGIFVAVIVHYEHVYKNSPKMKARREAKARAKAIKEGRVPEVVVTQTGINPLGTPVYAATPQGATA
jgi:hypothetical protein